MGRPTKFKPEFVKQVEKLCNLAATDEEIADFFDIDVSTVDRWKLSHEDFGKALKIGKEAADQRVERSLYQKAVGYSQEDTKVFLHEGEPVLAKYTKHYAPDTTAMIFWLKNRKRVEWREKQEIENTHTLKGGIMVVPMASGVEEWEKCAAASQKELMEDAVLIG